jgi:3-isopropylmalate dehydrogenase
VQAWPQLKPLIGDLDITILRENTEGFYPDRNLAWGYGEFKPTADVGLSLRVITAPACERFARFAFEYAATANIDRLAVIHKRTALPQTEGIFIGAFERLHPEFPNIQLELVRIDTFSSSFPAIPTATGSSHHQSLWRHPVRPGFRPRRRRRHRPVIECRP